MKLPEDNNQNKFTIDKLLEFCKKNFRYLSAGLLVVLLIIILAVTAIRAEKKDREKGTNKDAQQEQEAEKDQLEEEFAVDAIPEINELVTNYYKAYAAGDLKSLVKYAKPISDLEKGYITLLSKYVKGYKNLKCYTKKGLEDGSYVVSVSLEMQFKKIKTTAAGLDFFYVKTDKDGNYYVDNLYSQFNQKNQEQEMDSDVVAFIASYEKKQDVIDLLESTQKKYNEALAADKALKKMAETTIPEAIQAWLADDTESNTEEEPKTDTEEEPKADTEEEPKTDTPEEPKTDAAEKVYAIDNINIRKEPNESAEKVGSAVKGDSLTRTAKSEDGWSTIEYNGGTAYVKSDFLSTEAPAADTGGQAEQPDTEPTVNYVPEGKTLTMNASYNIRSSMSEEGEKVGTTAVGDTIKVILSYQEGWTKVEWNGTTGYIKTDLLLNN